MSEPIPGSEPTANEPEISRFSLWFLRGALVVATLVVVGFLAQAVISLLDDDGDGGDETVAEFFMTLSLKRQ